jgi:hypothetical protein
VTQRRTATPIAATLRVSDPDAGLALPAGGHESKVSDRADEHILEQAQVGVQVPVRVERDDRVADDLAGAVIGDVTAAVGSRRGDAFARQAVDVPAQIRLRPRAHPQGEYGLVLGEHQRVADRAGDPLLDQRGLPE